MKTIRPPKKRILVIDDNPGILFTMCEALKLKDYEVEAVERFLGVEAIKKGYPDLIYLDISLVGQDGREIAQELKSDERTRHIPIIILTAHPNANELAKEAGADGYISKPFKLEHLWVTTEKYA